MDPKNQEKLDALKENIRQRKLQAEALTSLSRSVNAMTQLLDRFFGLLDKAEKVVSRTAARDVEVKEAFEGLKKSIESIEMQPVIKVAAPQVHVPAPNVNVKAMSPAIDDINARYKRAKSTVAGDGTYHGFVDKNGNWFIQRETEGNNSASSGYYVGSGDFTKGYPKFNTYEYKLFSEVKIS